MDRRHTWIALACAALMSACGGGDGDSGTSPFIPPTDDFATLTGWQNLLGTGGTWTVVGTGSDGAAYEATLQIGPVAAAVFPPTVTSYARTSVLSTLKRNSLSLGTSTVEYFRAADFTVQAVRSTSGGVEECAQATASVLPPAVAKVTIPPTSGALMSLDNLNVCTPGALVDGKTTATWSLEFERGVVLLCLNSESRDLTNQVLGRENDCVEIATNGALGTRARVTIVVSGLTLVMRNF